MYISTICYRDYFSSKKKNRLQPPAQMSTPPAPDIRTSVRPFSVRLGETIGNGSYAKVYYVELYSGEGTCLKTSDAALKYIEHSKTQGLTSVLEPYITKYLNTGALIKAIKVDIDTGGNFQIIQPLALGDAATLVRKQSSSTKLKGTPLSGSVPIQLLKRWCWQLVCAVAHLHAVGIAHCDIKAANVLLFGNAITTSSVRLADYSMAVLIMDAKQGTKDVGSNISYTCTHRPPEVWQGKQWSYSADIWALACTFYELGYQQLLFPDQRSTTDLKDHSLQAITEWYNLMTSSITSTNLTSKTLPLPSESPHMELKLTHKPLNLVPRWERSEMKSFNDLLLHMLLVDSSKRSTIWEVIKHNFFDEVRDMKELPTVLNFPLVKYPYVNVQQSIVDSVSSICSDPQVVEVALALYQNYPHCEQKSPSLRTFVIVAHKILYRSLLPGSNKLSWTEIEEEISLYTSLRHHLLPT